MNKILWVILLSLFLSLNLNYSYASDNIWNKLTIINYTEEKINIWKIFNFFASKFEEIPESYKYITVNYKDVEKWSELEWSIQKLLYLDLIKNPKILLNKESELNAWSFYRLAEKILEIQILDDETKEILTTRNTNYNDLNKISSIIWDRTIKVNTKLKNKELKEKIETFNDVYNIIMNNHYDKDKLDEVKILESAISWIASWTNDKHTVYFNKIEGENFIDSLASDYEGIGSYVDMEKPGLVRIISPIPDSPSEKAGLKWWDIIKKVNWKDVQIENSLSEVISWIKWPAWTQVILTIDRNWETLNITVTRAKIIIVNIESKIINSDTYYIQIKSFWDKVKDDFKESLLKLKEEKNIKRIVIDLRNNWWWMLDEVSDILWYFIPEWEAIAREQFYNYEEVLTSNWYNLLDFNKYKIVILQNSWTASASEILIWTLKDYYPNTTLIWENTYGKGSVQELINLNDGWLLKYTKAKWFTWKTKTWIDWVWIKPDIELEFDLENYNKNWVDNQLNKALSIN